MSRIKEWLGSDSSFEDADTSDPWFVRHEQIMDVALVLASASANEREKMQMNEMTHPRCFNSRKEYDSWRESARMCGEYCTICHDCTPAYAHEMQLQGRCDKTIFWGFVPKKRLDDSKA